ncbi:DUF3156 family protein [Heyndrickxia coagulans]|uniref:DUF3156 family protein n=1 Tax=Heyndrickxia coagulans TaxID=1398 RepID=UPI000E4716C2|nr:DUF3156 family protein [Heyndrickxia coagulans]RGR84989.1 DUF3156 family protein [Heyndrickxia coagulans]RGR98215.1 DUF3156 family protein [Heyndrickxia coagulans]
MKLSGIEQKAAACFRVTIAQFGLKLHEINGITYTCKTENGEWRFELMEKKTLFSRIYQTKITYCCLCPGFHPDSGLIEWHYKKKWISENSAAFAKILNSRKTLNQLISSLDLEKVWIKHAGNRAEISVTPLPGSYISILLPPLRYFIRLKDNEVSKIRKIVLLFRQTAEAVSGSCSNIF